MQENHATSDSNSWAPNPERLELDEDEIHVWRAYLDCDETVLRQFEATLSIDEKARANRFFFLRDRNRFIATRGVLRELLGRYVNQAPARLEFDYGPHGKPTVRTEFHQPSIEFNVSHSHGVALLAFAVGRHLGVDVELVQPDFAGEKISERYFSPPEVMELRGLPPSLQDEGFFLCWTRKEAYVKARGEGLHVPLKSFHVTLTPGAPERLQTTDGFHWGLCSLRPDPQYVGALVGEGRDWKLRCWSWRPAVGY
jgi:4'-phosphopantetheinyl transferase